MLRAFLSSFSVVMIGVGCAFLTHLILVKILPASEYGIFSFIYSVSLLLSVFSLFGFQNSVVRLIPVYQNNVAKIKKLITFSRGFTFLLSIASALIAFSILMLFNFDEKYPVIALLFSLILVPFMVFMRLNSAYLRGLQRSAYSVLYETSLKEILFLVFIGGVVFFGGGIENSIDVLILLSVSMIVVIIASWFHVHFVVTESKIAENNVEVSRKEWINTSFPMMFTIFMQRLLRRSDIIILGLMTHPALVGIYAIAAQFSEAGSISQKVVQSVFSSRASKYYSSNQISELRTLYFQNLLFSVLCTGAFCILILFLFPYILAFIDSSYQSAYQALIILLIGHFLMVCTGPAAALLAMTRYEKTVMWITFVVAIGNVIFNIPMIYLYGVEGAAIVTSFFMILRNVISLFYVIRYKILTTASNKG